MSSSSQTTSPDTLAHKGLILGSVICGIAALTLVSVLIFFVMIVVKRRKARAVRRQQSADFVADSEREWTEIEIDDEKDKDESKLLVKEAKEPQDV